MLNSGLNNDLHFKDESKQVQFHETSRSVSAALALVYCFHIHILYPQMLGFKVIHI